MVSYLYFWRKLNAVKILPAKTECDGRAVEIAHGRQISCSLKGEGGQISTEILSK